MTGIDVTSCPTEDAELEAAAFFDLDHTLISRATPLALANSFRRRGLIRRRDLVRAARERELAVLRFDQHQREDERRRAGRETPSI